MRLRAPPGRRGLLAIAMAVVVVAGVACIPPPPPPPGATLADTFTRDPGVLGRAETGQLWEEVAGTWAVASGQAGATSSGSAMAVADAGLSDGRYQLSVPVVSSEFWAVLRVGGALDHWRFGRSGDGPYGLERVRSGVPTVEGVTSSATVVPAAGDRISCELDGEAVTCSVNGVEVASALDTFNEPETRFGVAASSEGAEPSTARFDDVSFIRPLDPELHVAITGGSTGTVGVERAAVATVTNTGGGAADPVILTLTLPVQDELVAVTASQGTCSQVGSTVTCVVGEVAPGGSAGVTTTVRAVDSGEATLVAEVRTGVGGATLDGASHTTTIVPAPGPTIDVWYGSNQASVPSGTPQRWVDVLGTVRSAQTITATSFSVNGGAPRPLSLGPNRRRLLSAGDYVAQIPVADLVEGENRVVVSATDAAGTTTRTVRLQHSSGSTWPRSTTVDWSAATNPTSVARVVDGRWRIDGGQLRTQVLGYDRLVAIGDRTWTDYEVSVPVTVHAVNLSAPAPSGFPLIGLFLRWNGHNDTVTPGSQPQQGWLPDGVNPTPLGAIALVRWKSATSTPLQLWNHRSKVAKESSALTMQLGTSYVFKTNVTTLTSGSTRYRFKVWRLGDPEPATWTLEFVAGTTDLQPPSGSLVLVAHEADVSFGTVTVRGLP